MDSKKAIKVLIDQNCNEIQSLKSQLSTQSLKLRNFESIKNVVDQLDVQGFLSDLGAQELEKTKESLYFVLGKLIIVLQDHLYFYTQHLDGNFF